MCNYQDEIKCFEHVCCTSQDKVQQVQKGAQNICHVRLLQSRDLYQQWISQEIENRRYHDNIKIKTLNGEESEETESISDLKVTSSTGKSVWIDLPVWKIYWWELGIQQQQVTLKIGNIWRELLIK